MRKFFEKYNAIEEKLLIFSLVFNVVVVSLQIIMRSIFNTSISWSEELSRYIFIWEIWMGVSVAYRYNEHIKVDLIFSVFKSKKAKKAIDFLTKLIWLSFNIFLVYQGIKLLQSMADRNALSSGMRIPLTYVYAALPVGSLIVCIRIIFDLFRFNRIEENVIYNSELEEAKETNKGAEEWNH